MAKTTNNPANRETPLEAKNAAIKAAYENILKDIKEALPQFSSEYLRTFVEVDYNSLKIKCKHGFFSPLIHLQLEDIEGSLQITFSRNHTIKQQIGNYLDGLISRIVYKNTAESVTSIPIEDSVSSEIYRVDDFRQANNLILKGFKDGKKVTV